MEWPCSYIAADNIGTDIFSNDLSGIDHFRSSLFNVGIYHVSVFLYNGKCINLDVCIYSLSKVFKYHQQTTYRVKCREKLNWH